MESDRKPSVMMRKFLDYNPSVRRFGTALQTSARQSSALRKGALLLLRHLDGPKYAFRSPRNSRKGRRSSLPSFSATDASFGVPILRSLMKSPGRPFMASSTKLKLWKRNRNWWNITVLTTPLYHVKSTLEMARGFGDVLSSGRMMSHALGKGLLISALGGSSSEVANVLKMAGYGSGWCCERESFPILPT
jgi:hypothetical protein